MNCKDNISWEQYHNDILRLAEKIRGYQPDIIAPVMLGGLIPAAIIAKKLKINDVRPMNIVRTGHKRKITYGIHGPVKNKKILILEDDLQTGLGPKHAKQKLEKQKATVKTATIYLNQKAKPNTDYYTKTVTKPPIYPWKKPLQVM